MINHVIIKIIRNLINRIVEVIGDAGEEETQAVNLFQPRFGDRGRVGEGRAGQAGGIGSLSGAAGNRRKRLRAPGDADQVTGNSTDVGDDMMDVDDFANPEGV